MDAAIQTADQQLAFITSDEDARRAYEMRFTAMCDETSNKNYFTNKGRDEKALEIARKMKEFGDSIEKIQAITGLSAEVIETL